MKNIITIPNVLSAVRILLVPFFLFYYIYIKDFNIALIILAVSGVSDVADGYIARHFHMVSDLGKVLDPVADKLTQLTVLICLCVNHHKVIWLAVLLLAKDLLMLVGGIIVIKNQSETPSARWWGKLATVVVFFTMVLFLIIDLKFIPGLNDSNPICWIMVIASMVFLTFSLVQYFRNNKEDIIKG